MRTRIAPLALGLFGTVTIVLVTAVPTEACLFHGWFGCCAPARTSYYPPPTSCAPVCPTFGGRQTFYRSTFFGRPVVCDPCAPVTCPTGVGTGGTGGTGATGGSVGGGAQLGEPSTSPQPTPADQQPRTFREGQRPADGEEDPWEATQPSDESDLPDETGEQHETQKPPAEQPAEDVPESVIRQKKPAPTGPPTPPQDGTQDGAQDKSQDDTQDDGNGGSDNDGADKATFQEDGPRVLPANLDDVITWRTAPRRTRLILRPSFATPEVARTKVKINADWVPVSSDTKVVRK